MKRWLIWLIVILLALLGSYWVYLTFFQSEPAPQEEASQNGENGNGETTPPLEEEPGEMVEISVSGTSYRFTPAAITVAAGAKVRLTFTNTDSFMAHDFVISALGVSTALVSPGGSQTIDFTAPASAGSFEFICSVPGHAELGMRGTLVVE